MHRRGGSSRPAESLRTNVRTFVWKLSATIEPLYSNVLNSPKLLHGCAKSWETRAGDVRHQSFWPRLSFDIMEPLAHLVRYIKRRICDDASVGFQLSFV
jgi:hypothetical protein